MIDRLPEPPSPAASKGTLVHRALEFLMLRPPEGRTPAAALTDLDRARLELADHPEFAGLELGPDQFDAFHADARALVLRYFEVEDPATIRPIGLELRLGVTVGSLTLRGVIDRLELDDDGELVVTDYKTGAVPNERAEPDRLGGVHFYSLLCDRLFARRPVRVQLMYLFAAGGVVGLPSEQSVTGMERKALALYAAGSSGPAPATTSGPTAPGCATGATSRPTARRGVAIPPRRPPMLRSRRGPEPVLLPA